MAGAVGTHLLLLRLARRRSPARSSATGAPTAPAGATAAIIPAHLAVGEGAPQERRLADPRLVGGAALFGAGWGLVGFCPGPALVSLVTGLPAALVFTAAMAAGMLAYRHLPGLLRRREDAGLAPARAALTQECG